MFRGQEGGIFRKKGENSRFVRSHRQDENMKIHKSQVSIYILIVFLQESEKFKNNQKKNVFIHH